MARLIEVGQLDDERFAARFAEDKRDLSGWGPERIREALLARGVSCELAEAALDEGHEAQVERATSLLIGRGEALDDDRRRARALALLTRRGFDYDVAYAAVRRASS